MRNVTRNFSNHATTMVSLKDFIIPEAVVDFPKCSAIPAGYYFSEILDVQPRLTNSGKKCVDIVYYLQGFREDQGDHVMRLSYPEGSQPLQDLYKAMLNAGVPAGSSLEAAIGVTERIHLIYDDEDSIGRIHRRVYDPPQANDSADEEEEE
jgi:hypothetical protein